MPAILGVNFLGGPESLEKFARKIRWKNSLRNSPGNSPKIRQAKIKNST